SQVQRLLQLRGHLGQHRHAAAHVKSAYHDRDLVAAQNAGDIHRSGKLIALNPHQADHAGETVASKATDDPSQRDYLIGFIVRGDLDVDVVAERAAGCGIDREPVETGERIGGYPPAPPLDYVPVIVVVRRLYQIDQKPAPGRAAARSAALG